MKSRNPIKICFIVTASVSLYGLYRNQWDYWLRQGYIVHAVANHGPEHNLLRKIGIVSHAIPIQRKPSPLHDLLSLIYLIIFFYKYRFNIIHVSTPKAAFLGSIAAYLSGHNNIVYTVHGRPYENMKGIIRFLFEMCERITCHLSTIILPVCHELGKAISCNDHRIANKTRVIGLGSNNGVDVHAFQPTPETTSRGLALRQTLLIPTNDIVLLFVGWLRREKGINELVNTFSLLSYNYSCIHLILLGNYEMSDPLNPDTIQVIGNHPRIHHCSWQWDTIPYYAASDIFVFPSHREGFGNAILEASAMELPVIACDIMGCRESVKSNVTGLLVPPMNISILYKTIERLIFDTDLRKQLGKNGRIRICNNFIQEHIWHNINSIYLSLISQDYQRGTI